MSQEGHHFNFAHRWPEIPRPLQEKGWNEAERRVPAIHVVGARHQGELHHSNELPNSSTSSTRDVSIAFRSAAHASPEDSPTPFHSIALQAQTACAVSDLQSTRYRVLGLVRKT